MRYITDLAFSLCLSLPLPLGFNCHIVILSVDCIKFISGIGTSAPGGGAQLTTCISRTVICFFYKGLANYIRKL